MTEATASRTRTRDDPDNRIYNRYPVGIHPGCRVTVLDDVLAYYSTKITPKKMGFWLRQLQPTVTPDQFDRAPQVHQQGRRPAVSHRGCAVRAGSRPRCRGSERPSSPATTEASLFFGTYFCAQLVADSYMHMGLLEMELFPPNGYSPAAFDDGRQQPAPPGPARDARARHLCRVGRAEEDERQPVPGLQPAHSIGTITAAALSSVIPPR